MSRNELENYARKHSQEDSAVVQELIDKSTEELQYVDMISGPLVGGLLALLIKLMGAKRVLEIGTFTGYSALKMAESLLENGTLITCEYNRRYEKIARSFFERPQFASKIKLVMGKALQTIPELEGNFDFVFLDADKNNYPAYYDLILPRLQPGGLMVIDNVFWDGEVLNASSKKARAIHLLNEKIADDERVEQLMLMVRDGVTILRKNKKSPNPK